MYRCNELLDSSIIWLPSTVWRKYAKFSSPIFHFYLLFNFRWLDGQPVDPNVTWVWKHKIPVACFVKPKYSPNPEYSFATNYFAWLMMATRPWAQDQPDHMAEGYCGAMRNDRWVITIITTFTLITIIAIAIFTIATFIITIRKRCHHHRHPQGSAWRS